MKLKERICKLKQSTLTQAAERRDQKYGEMLSYYESEVYHKNSRYIKFTSKMFREKVEKDVFNAILTKIKNES